MVSRVQQTLAVFGQKKGLPSCLRDAMPKALYWLGTALMTNQVMENAFRARSNGASEFVTTITERLLPCGNAFHRPSVLEWHCRGFHLHR